MTDAALETIEMDEKNGVVTIMAIRNDHTIKVNMLIPNLDNEMEATFLFQELLKKLKKIETQE